MFSEAATEHKNSSESGSISIISAIFLLSIVALIIAVITHGQYANGYTRTRETATNAARVGAQEIDINYYLESGEKKLDEEAAAVAVRSYLRSYPAIDIVSLRVSETRIEVTVSETIEGMARTTKKIISKGRAIPLQDR